MACRPPGELVSKCILTQEKTLKMTSMSWRLTGEYFLSESAKKWGWELEKEEEGEEEAEEDGWSKSTWFKGPYILLSLVKL